MTSGPGYRVTYGMPRVAAARSRRWVPFRRTLPYVLAVGLLASVTAALWDLAANRAARRESASCVANLARLGRALALYAQDYDGRWPAALHAWPIHGGNPGGNIPPRVPYTAEIAAYVGGDRVYTCPSDHVKRVEGGLWDGSFRGNLLPRSYAITGAIVTLGSASLMKPGRHGPPDPDLNTGTDVPVDRNTGIMDHAVAQASEPARTVAIAENWVTYNLWLRGVSHRVNGNVVGGNVADVINGCRTSELPGRNTPPQYSWDRLDPCSAEYNYGDVPFPESGPVLPRGHRGLGNYLFADGHVKPLSWRQVSAIDFELFRISK